MNADQRVRSRTAARRKYVGTGRHAATDTEATDNTNEAHNLFPSLDHNPRHRKEGTS